MPPPEPVKEKSRYFTVDEANRMLPLVRRIVADIVQQWELVNDLERRLSTLSRRGSKAGPPRDGDPYEEESARSQAELDGERAKLAGYIEELKSLGVELKGPDGLCDFPSLREGREVYLCWRLGEPEVGFWHELRDGFAGRKPLTPSPAGAGGGKPGH
jgi:hypothetical protein